MLGGGNPITGSNPTGTGSTLNYVGNHAYAHSGAIAVNNSDVVLLEFDVAANQYIVAKITVGSKAGTGDDLSYSVFVDGELVYGAYDALVNMNTQNALNILLPPQSKIRVEGRNLGSASGREMECVVVGRVYA